MEWKFKKNAESQGSSSGFWYDLVIGGYINPEEVLEDSDQLSKLNNAIELLSSFEGALEDAELLNEI